MKEDIYELLNNVVTNLEEYDSGEMEAEEAGKRTEEILCRLNGETQERIQENPAAGKENRRRKNARNRWIKKFMKGAAVFLLALISAGGVAYAATDGAVFHEIREMFSMISGGTISETTTYYTDGSEEVVVRGTSTAQMAGENSGFPLLLEEGRLYFTGDGEKRDITDEISETEPLYIDIIDEQGNTHKFVIGGKAQTGCYGYNEMLIDKDGTFRGATGSYGENMNIMEKTPEWLQKAEEEVIGYSMR